MIKQDRQHIEQDSEETGLDEMRKEVGETASFHIDHTHHLNEIADGIHHRYLLHPLRHTGDRGKQTAEEDEQDHKEESRQHGLLLRGRHARHNQSETGEDNQEYGRKEIDNAITAHEHQSVDHITDRNGNGQEDDADNPERQQLGVKEKVFRNRRHVHLLYGSFFFLTDQTEGRQETTDDRQQEYHDARHHIDLVTQMRIEQRLGTYAVETFCHIALFDIEVLLNQTQIRASPPLVPLTALAAMRTSPPPSLCKSRSKFSGISMKADEFAIGLFQLFDLTDFGILLHELQTGVEKEGLTLDINALATVLDLTAAVLHRVQAGEVPGHADAQDAEGFEIIVQHIKSGTAESALDESTDAWHERSRNLTVLRFVPVTLRLESTQLGTADVRTQ